VAQFVAEQCRLSTKAPIVAFHGKLSPWLQNAAVAAALKTKSLSFNLCDPKELELLLDLKNERIILLLDMIDTGETTAALIETLLQNSQGIEMVAMSVLTTQLDDKQKRIRTFRSQDKHILINCLLEVEQRKFPKGECEMCQINLPFSDDSGADESEYCGIDTYHMWSTVQRAGLQFEDNVPGYRSAVSKIPRFQDVIQDHAAWIVDKFRQSLDLLPNGRPSDAVLVCPEDAGAGILAEHMRLFLNYSVIQLPRRVIEDVSKWVDSDSTPEVVPTAWADMRWFDEVNSIRAPISPIMIDVFNISGRTLEAVEVLLKKLLKPASVCLLYVDFNPNASERLGCRVLSLYEFQAKFEPLAKFTDEKGPPA
jgi:hypothetical protein